MTMVLSISEPNIFNLPNGLLGMNPRTDDIDDNIQPKEKAVTKADKNPLPIDEWSEEELLVEALNYNELALGAIYDRYETKIYAYIYRRTGEQFLAEDLTAQVFLKLLEAIQKGKVWHSSFSGWLFRIAHNLIIDYYRRRDRQNQIPLDEAPVLPTDGDNPVLIAEINLDAERLRTTMQRLTDEQAEVIQLRFLDGYSIREAAFMMGKSEGAVKTLQYRAVTRLRELLEFEQTLDGER